MYWEVHAGGAKGADKTVLECLDGAFSGIDFVITWFNKLEATLLRGKVGFYCFCDLIVHKVDFGSVSFAHKKFKVHFVCFQNALRFKASNWRREDGVCFIVC